MRAPPLRRAQLDISHEPRSHQRRNLRGGDTNGRFWPDRPALPRIKSLAWTKTHDKTFAVLGGF